MKSIPQDIAKTSMPQTWHIPRQDKISEPEKFAERLRSSSRTVLTEAMREGIANEPFAVEAYGKLKEGNVNIYPCGIVISPRAAWMAASPDRKVLDPSSNPPFGLLEVKCPDLRNKDLCDLQYLSLKDNGQLALKATCNYYHQIQMQLAMTGLKWCDFFVWSERQHHLERIDFCPESWQRVKDKADKFFFDYLLS
ncbi:uncharacterized protein LOC124275736 [Haliotis rubra]|uniref:uncharacterized protein LOC124275736 n=1 Tax=Haliotis rubra TaxID=36100 RepID=UPI001EE55555|nr:uncharacterized protein LOC124275736 [Haliotis rubra]